MSQVGLLCRGLVCCVTGQCVGLQVSLLCRRSVVLCRVTGWSVVSQVSALGCRSLRCVVGWSVVVTGWSVVSQVGQLLDGLGTGLVCSRAPQAHGVIMCRRTVKSV